MTPPRASAAYLRRHLPEVCGAIVGVAFGFLFLFMTAPSNFLSRLVIVSGPTCPKSEKLVSSIVADPELQRVFTPLSVSDDDAHPDVARLCELGYEHVLAEAPWFRVAGRDWVCSRLKEAAMQYRDEAHAILPVWVHDGSMIEVSERDRLLEDAGYYLLPAGDGVVVHADAAEVLERPKPPPAGSLSEWRGQAIGF